MIEEYGVVVKLEPEGIAVVQCQKTSACAHCAAKSACAVGLGSDSGVRQVEVSNELGASVGETVKLVTSSDRYLRSSLVLYGLPILFLVAGAVIGLQLGGQGMSLVGGIGALVASFFIIRLATSGVNKREYMPRIEEIIESGEIPQPRLDD